MKHSDFVIGEIFYSSIIAEEIKPDYRKWRCTDIGTRIITAIRLDKVEVVTLLKGKQTQHILNENKAEAEGWFNGPPYAVAEVIFDEYSFEVCQKEPPLTEETIAKGHAAYVIGDTLNANPHPEDSDEYRLWRWGWENASRTMKPRVDKVVYMKKRRR